MTLLVLPDVRSGETGLDAQRANVLPKGRREGRPFPSAHLGRQDWMRQPRRTDAGAGNRTRPAQAPLRAKAGGLHGGLHDVRTYGAYGISDSRNHARERMVTGVGMGGTGLEPVTPSLSSWCSPN